MATLPTISLRAPVGGETYNVGQRIVPKWSTNRLPTGVDSSTTAYVELSIWRQDLQEWIVRNKGTHNDGALSGGVLLPSDYPERSDYKLRARVIRIGSAGPVLPDRGVQIEDISEVFSINGGPIVEDIIEDLPAPPKAGSVPTGVNGNNEVLISILSAPSGQTLATQHQLQDEPVTFSVNAAEPLITGVIQTPLEPSIQFQIKGVSDDDWMGPGGPSEPNRWFGDGGIGQAGNPETGIEGLRMRLRKCPGATIEYRVYSIDLGWQDWVKDGEPAGYIGLNRYISAFQARTEGAPQDFEISYRGMFNRLYGGDTWSEWVISPTIIGLPDSTRFGEQLDSEGNITTAGQPARLEAISFDLVRLTEALATEEEDE